MIHELGKSEYEKALPILKRLDYTNAVNSVIEGYRPGKIYVDNVAKPRVAFVWAKSSEYFLAGSPSNDEFFFSLQRLINKKITPEVTKNRIKFSTLYYTPDLQNEKLQLILRNLSAWKSYRWEFHITRNLNVNWKEKVPSGFQMKYVDSKLLEQTNLKNIDRVIDHIAYKWGSIEDFLRKGFGFCLIHEGMIVSWCVSSNNTESKCEINVQTDQTYRNRGFATLTVSALIEHCISKNIICVYQCGHDNAPSIALAERLGFRKKTLHTVYNWISSGYKHYSWLLGNKSSKIFRAVALLLKNKVDELF